MLMGVDPVIWRFQLHLPRNILLQHSSSRILFLKITTTDSQSSVDNSTNVTDHQEGANATAIQDSDSSGLDGATRMDQISTYFLLLIIILGAYF